MHHSDRGVFWKKFIRVLVIYFNISDFQITDSSAEYFGALSKRLSSEGYYLAPATSIGKYRIDLLAAKSSLEATKLGEITRFIIGTAMDSVTPDLVGDFSSVATKYAFDNRDSYLPRGVFAMVVSFPLIVSDDFTDDLKKWMSDTVSPKHWSATESPVLVSLKGRELYFCRKTPMWGADYYRGFRKFAEKELVPTEHP